MKITSIHVTGLFGVFDYDIELNTVDRITIIHGPNGSGKTTILTLIKELFGRNLLLAAKTYFKSIQIVFANKSSLTITKGPDPKEKNVILSFVLEEKDGSKKVHNYKPEKDDYKHFRNIRHIIDDLDLGIIQIEPAKWLDPKTGERYDLAGLMVKYANRIPAEYLEEFQIPSWLSERLSSIKIHFIQTQRLLDVNVTPNSRFPGRREIETQNTVDKCAKSIAGIIQGVMQKSATISSSLDRLFPIQFLNGAGRIASTEAQLRAQYDRQSKYRIRLMNAGLIDAEKEINLPDGTINKSQREFLYHYLNDIDKKYEVYEDALAKCELFLKMINQRFQFKSLALSGTKGFIVKSVRNDDVPLAALSSGEQHEIILTYELIFEASNKSLIIIDEPELSLHVTWQHLFLNDLAEISKASNLDFIVATHSPSIINSRTDLMRVLEDKRTRPTRTRIGKREV